MEKKIILLVEDNPDEVLLAERAFKKSGIPHNMVVAQNGAEALDYLYGVGKYDGRNIRIKPHVVLLDLKMPRMGGFEVLQHIRSDARTKFQRVVVLTTSSEDADRIESYRLGTDSYIRKSDDFNQFASAIKQIGLYWLYLNEAP